MRFIFGVIVGIALTVGAALLHDNNVPPANSPLLHRQDLTNEPIVNWDALGAVTRQETEFVAAWWDNLMGRPPAQPQP
jgi:hypothetical protein